jgi:copper(I)-binding protein
MSPPPRTGRRMLPTLLLAPLPVPMSRPAAATRPATAQRAAQGIVIEQPWTRATFAAGGFAAAYASLRNAGAVEDRLVGAETPLAAAVEFSVQCGGSGATPGVILPPGQTLTLEPGGPHLMLIGLRRPLERGQEIPLTLRFARAGALVLSLRVEAAGARRPRFPA